MPSAPFSLERALRITAPFEPQTGTSGAAFRDARLLGFDEVGSMEEGDARRSARWSATLAAASRICGLDVLRMRGPSYSVVDAGRTLLTYVLRHSAGGINWRNSHGESTRLEPGALMVSQSRQDSLVEVSPAVHDETCDCVHLMLQDDPSLELSVRLGPHEFTFCNSENACVRLMLGNYSDHAARELVSAQLRVLDIDLVPLTDVEIPVANDRLVLVLLTSGTLQIHGHVAEPLSCMAFFGSEPLVRLATLTGASALWFDVPYIDATQPMPSHQMAVAPWSLARELTL